VDRGIQVSVLERKLDLSTLASIGADIVLGDIRDAALIQDRAPLLKFTSALSAIRVQLHRLR
jgi:hypothetical protein